MSKTFLKVGTGPKSHVFLSDNQDVIRAIEASNKALSEIIKVNTEFGSNSPLEPSQDMIVFIPVASRDRLGYNGTMSLTSVTHPSCQHVDEANKLASMLSKYMIINNIALSRLPNSTLSCGDTFLTLFSNEATLYTVIDGELCSGCDEPIDKADIESHKASRFCFIKSSRNAATNAGFVKAGTLLEADLIRRVTSIPSMFIPETVYVWTPQWVIDAIASYNSNSGYADLSLEEFLDKLARNQPE